MATYIITDKERAVVQSVLGRLLVGDPTLQLMRREFKDELRAAATILQTLSPATDPTPTDPGALAETLEHRPKRRTK